MKAKLTTFKEIINGADLEDTLHVLVQDADLRFPIGINDKLCEKEELSQQLLGNLAHPR
jgi:hypothetical protein